MTEKEFLTEVLRIIKMNEGQRRWTDVLDTHTQIHDLYHQLVDPLENQLLRLRNKLKNKETETDLTGTS